MKFSLKTSPFALLAMAILVTGCGGGGGGGTSNPVVPVLATPTASVDWPVRTRNLLGPSSALSVSIKLHPQNVSGSDITFVGDRSSSLVAHTDAYTASSQGYVGQWQLTATFYSAAGETGAVVGTATSQVDLSASGALTKLDGTALGALSFSPTIVRVAIGASQTVPFYSTTQLSATAYDASNNVVVVSPGSYSWSQSSGSSNLSLTPDGIATPIQNGTGSVSVSIDGLTSASVPVSVVPATLTFNYPAYGFAYDATRSVLYAAVSNYPSSGAAAILKINPVTGAIAGSVATPSVQHNLVVSNDGTTLYALSTDGSFQVIDLSSLTITTTGSLPANTFPVSAVALPLTLNSWLVSTRDSSLNDTGTFVYDGTFPRPNSAQIGLSIAVNSTGDTAYGYQYLTPSSNSRNFSIASISPSGITLTSSIVSPFQVITDQIHFLNGAVVSDDGTVLSASTGATLATLGITSSGHVATGANSRATAYFAEFSPAVIASYDLGSDSLTNTYTLPASVNGNLNALTYAGPGYAAFFNSAGTSNQFFLVGGLP